MAQVDITYHNLLRAVVEHGYWYEDKSRDVRRKQLTSTMMEFYINEEFPLITTKKMFTKGIFGELIWFLRGDSSIKYLHDNDIYIWDKDIMQYAKRKGLEFNPEFSNAGRNYGVQWRNWSNFDWINGDPHHTVDLDQISNLINNLRDNPMNTRNIVTAWNPAELNDTALPPCHWSFEVLPRPLYEFEKEEWKTDKDYCFTLKWHQRSVDVFLGLPFNIASYAALAHVIGRLTNMIPYNLIGDLSNVHIYEPHLDAVKEQLHRSPTQFEAPKFIFNKVQKMDMSLSQYFQSLDISDFGVEDYKSYDKIAAEMLEPKI